MTGLPFATVSFSDDHPLHCYLLFLWWPAFALLPSLSLMISLRFVTFSFSDFLISHRFATFSFSDDQPSLCHQFSFSDDKLSLCYLLFLWWPAFALLTSLSLMTSFALLPSVSLMTSLRFANFSFCDDQSSPCYLAPFGGGGGGGGPRLNVLCA